MESFHISKIVLFSNFIHEFSQNKTGKRNDPTGKRAVVKSKTLFHQFRPSAISQVFLLENLRDVCLRKHRCVKIGNRSKNCSWGQVVTGGRILLSCFLGLCYTKDINFVFLPLKFSGLLFSHRRVMGLISSTHQSVWRAKNALQLRYTWFPGMSDLLRFEISQVFLLENLCDVCLRKHRCVKIGNRLKNLSCGQVVTRVWIL